MNAPAPANDAMLLNALQHEVVRRGLVVSRDEPLARHTTFRIGGPADLYIVATGQDELEGAARLAWSCEAPALVLGGGSNMLVSDAGVRGLTVANHARAIHLRQSNNSVPAGHLPQVVAESGAALAGLARWCVREGWSGLEWAVSVPGSVGGAVIGNAGAHGGEISDNVAWALVALPEGGRAVLTVDDLAYTYRTSMLKKRVMSDAPLVVLAAGFEMVQGDRADMQARAETFLARRRASQPTEPSVGSIFRNPPGDYAGRLIEAAGLKGHRVGGACISIRHANFIVNDTGAATAADVLTLIDLMRARVYETAGVELTPEILFIGDWPQHPPYAPLA